MNFFFKKVPIQSQQEVVSTLQRRFHTSEYFEMKSAFLTDDELAKKIKKNIINKTYTTHFLFLFLSGQL